MRWDEERTDLSADLPILCHSQRNDHVLSATARNGNKLKLKRHTVLKWDPLYTLTEGHENLAALSLSGYITIGPLHGSGHMVQNHICWDFQNNATRTSPSGPAFVLEVPLCNLLTSKSDFVPCDWIVQRAYCTSKQPFFNKHSECRYKVWKENETSISTLNINNGKMNIAGLSGRMNRVN